MLDFFSYTWLHEAIHGSMIQLYKYIASIVYIYSLLNCFDRYVGVLEEVDGWGGAGYSNVGHWGTGIHGVSFC